MKKLSRFALSLLSILPLHGYANNLAVDIGTDTFNAELSTRNAIKNTTYAIGAISGEDDHKLYHFKATVTGELESNTNVTASLGGKVYYANLASPSDNVTALSLGGDIEYSVPQNNKVKFGLSLYIAPEVTTSGDYDLLTDITATASYQVLKNGAVNIHYRHLKISHADGGNAYMNDENIYINKGVSIGLSLTF